MVTRDHTKKSKRQSMGNWGRTSTLQIKITDDDNVNLSNYATKGVDEFGFTSGREKGMAQTLRPAAADQIDKNIDGKETTDENDGGGIADKKDDSEMGIDEQKLELLKIIS
ncbi:hypothetical protein Tco_0818951 [Tanacetum coccineum]